MRLKSYQDFLLESILYSSDEFKEILKSIKDDEIASALLNLIDKDIKTNYNILKTTGTNDIISFIPDSQTTTKLKSVNLPALFLLKSGNETGIGRIAKSLLSSNNILVKDKDLEKFVNKFKAAYDSKNKKVEDIRIVKGEDIRYWYSVKNYCEETIGGRGSLGKSCMRYDETQPFLDIYVDNPEVCGLVIKTNEDNKLVGRALVWETSRGAYLDRVYYTDEHDPLLIKNWVKLAFSGKEIQYFDKSPSKFEVKLRDNVDYTNFPYMDSIPYYYSKTHTLYNYENNDLDKNYLFFIQNTNGEPEPLNMVYCQYLDESWPFDEVIWSDILNSYLPKRDSIFSKHENSWLYKPRSVYSEIIDDYLDDNRAVQVFENDDKTKSKYYPRGNQYKIDYEMDSHSNEFFIKSLLIKVKGDYYLKSNSVIVYNIIDAEVSRFMKIYNKKNDNWILCNDLDIKLFNFKIEEGSEEVFQKINFFVKLYKDVIYKTFVEKIKSLNADAELKEEKLKEVKEANEHLLRRSDDYKIRNQFYEYFNSDLSIMNEYWKSIISDEKFDIAYKRSCTYSYDRKFLEIEGIKLLLKEYILDIKNISIQRFTQHWYETLNRVIESLKKILPNEDLKDRAYIFIGTLSDMSYRIIMSNDTYDNYLNVINYYFNKPDIFQQ